MYSAPTRSADLVARVVQDVWNTGRVGELDDLLAVNYVRHGCSGDTSVDTLKESILLARNAFPDMHTTIEHIVTEGGLVASHWRSVGTHSGPFYDLPVTGKIVEITGMTLSRLAHDRIVEEWENWDHTDLFASLGVVDLGVA